MIAVRLAVTSGEKGEDEDSEEAQAGGASGGLVV